MKSDDEWSRQELGIGCYLCPPRLATTRDVRKIATLSISELYLLADQQFLGHSALVFNAGHATRLDLLSDDQYSKFTNDLRLSVQSIVAAFHPDHLNVALLGNTCPHLHWGITPRYRDDPCWGRPVWMGKTDQPTAQIQPLAETVFEDLIAKIRVQLQLPLSCA